MNAAGDASLVKLGKRLTSALREIDLLARISGEEFAVLLPETGVAEARDAAERLRAVAAANGDDDGNVPRITVSAAETKLCLLKANSQRDDFLAY